MVVESNDPTARQIDAYRLVYVTGLTQEDAGKLLGCTQENISQLLKSLKKSKPHLFHRSRINRPIRYTGQRHRIRF